MSDSPQAKSCGSGSMRTRRSLGSGARISIETPRMLRRSMARNMPPSVAGRLCKRQDCKPRRCKWRNWLSATFPRLLYQQGDASTPYLMLKPKPQFGTLHTRRPPFAVTLSCIKGHQSYLANQQLPRPITAKSNWHYDPEEFQWILKLGVWLRTQISRRTKIGRDAARSFCGHDRHRATRRKPAKKLSKVRTSRSIRCPPRGVRANRRPYRPTERRDRSNIRVALDGPGRHEGHDEKGHEKKESEENKDLRSKRTPGQNAPERDNWWDWRWNDQRAKDNDAKSPGCWALSFMQIPTRGAPARALSGERDTSRRSSEGSDHDKPGEVLAGRNPGNPLVEAPYTFG